MKTLAQQRARWKSRKGLTLLSPLHNPEDGFAFKRAAENSPQHLRPSPNRLNAALVRLKAKWNKGDEHDTSND